MAYIRSVDMIVGWPQQLPLAMIITEASPTALGVAVAFSVAPDAVTTMTGCDQAGDYVAEVMALAG